MQIKYVFHTLLAGLLILSACQMQMPSTSGIKANTARLNSRTQRPFSLVEGPYTGPVSIKINTGLMQQGTGKVVEIKSQDNFKIQAVPQGPVVFSETMHINRPNEDFSRLFKVPNTGKRYLVHVAKQEPQRGRDSRVQVNLNGAWVIREKDFERGEEEFQTTGLLLNTNNSLKIRFKGKTGSRLTLTVVEAGEAGTILRRRGWEKDKDLTQADRIRNNDTNIFDPNERDSLGGLQPYEGDELLNPNNPNSAKIGVSNANGSQATIFVGEFYVTLAEPVEENLQYLLANYPIELAERYILGDHTEAIFKIKMDQASLQNLPETIAALNLRPGFPSLEEVVFSSVNTAKTVGVLSEILAHESERLVYIGLQNKAEKHFQNSNGKIVTEEENRSAIYSPTGFTQPVKSSDLWWIEATKVNQAWQYGLGQGVKVAVIDDAFGFIETYSDFKEQIPSTNHLSIGFYDDRAIRIGNASRLASDPGHGLWVSNIFAARSDDKTGILGVAPQATLIPMATGERLDTNVPIQLQKIYDGNLADVVNISQGRLRNVYDYYLSKKNEDAAVIKRYIELLNKLDTKNIIVVASTGNHGIENTASNANIPGSLTGLSPIISVGAYDKFFQRAFFGAPNTDFHASNFGAATNIWAPGKDLLVLNKEWNGSSYSDRLQSVSGTSYATPQVAGTVALLKGWKKSLNTAQVKSHLQTFSDSLSDKSGIDKKLSFDPSLAQPVTVKGLNALKALQGLSPSPKPYQTYTGTAQANGTVLINGTAYTPKPAYADLDASIQSGDTITLSGWLRADNPNIPANEIHVLGIGLGSAGSGPTFQPLQPIQTNGAVKLNTFEINGKYFLAFPNSFNGNTASLDVDLYEWNGSNFTAIQSIPAEGPNDVEPFQIGNDHFIAIAEYNSGTNLEINSRIYKWNSSTGRFNTTPHQIIPTKGAVDWKYFSMNGQHFLIVANFANNAGIPNTSSVLYTWNANTAQFENGKNVGTNGARDWEHIEVGGQHFLAVAEERPNYSGFLFSSRIFPWNGTQFGTPQTVQSEGARDWEAFKIGTRSFLALANRWKAGGGGANTQPSAIYEWKNNTFERIQTIDLHAISWDHFEANGTHYLISAHTDLSSGCNPNVNCPSASTLYRWDGNQFNAVPIQLNQPAIDWTFFNVGSTNYLAAASNYFDAANNSYNTASQVYTFIP